MSCCSTAQRRSGGGWTERQTEVGLASKLRCHAQQNPPSVHHAEPSSHLHDDIRLESSGTSVRMRRSAAIRELFRTVSRSAYMDAAASCHCFDMSNLYVSCMSHHNQLSTSWLRPCRQKLSRPKSALIGSTRVRSDDHRPFELGKSQSSPWGCTCAAVDGYRPCG